MPRQVPIHRLIATIAAAAATSVALFVLAGRFFGRGQLSAFGPNLVPMPPITALVLAICGLALILRLRRPQARGTEVAVLTAASLIALVALLVLARAVHDFPLPWDAWSSWSLPGTGGRPLGGMSPFTAANLILLAAAIAGTCRDQAGSSRIRTLARAVAGAGTLFMLVVILSYSSGSPLGYGRANLAMSLPTAITIGALHLVALLFGAATTDGEPSTTPAGDPLFSRNLSAITVGLLVLICGTGVALLRFQHQEARNQAFSILDGVSALKVQQIAQWREERMDDARFFLRTPAVRTEAASFLARPGDSAARDAILAWLESLRNRSTPYLAALLYDADGNLRLATPAVADGPAIPAGAAFAAALAKQDVVLGDLQRDAASGVVYMDACVPIPGLPAAGGAIAPPAGVIVLRIDPRKALFPMLQNWPIPSGSGELTLARREGDTVLFLNELRSRPGSALTLSYPVTDRNLPAAAGARGEFGSREGSDYRGILVLATVRAVPGSSWMLIAKMDRDEVYAEQTSTTWKDSSLISALMVAVILGSRYTDRRRHALLLERTLTAEQQRTVLAQRLAVITQHANDAIITFDERMRIVDANERAATLYGYLPDELQQLTVHNLRDPARATTMAADFAAVLQSDGLVFESIHRRRDGSLFPVEISARPVELGGRRHVLSIVRDISERQAQIRKIERLNRLYLVLSRIDQTLVHARTPAELFQQICDLLVGPGDFKLAWIGRLDPATRHLIPVATAGDEHGYVPQLDISTDSSLPGGRGPSGTALRENRIYVCNDFHADPSTLLWREAAARSGLAGSIALPLHQGSLVVGALTVYAGAKDHFQQREIELLDEAARDISYGLEVFAERSRRTEAEAALAAREEVISTIFSQALDGIVLVDPATGRFSEFNPAAHRSLGYTREEFGRLQLADIELEHDSARIRSTVEQMRREGGAHFDTRFRHRSGEARNVHVSALVVSIRGHEFVSAVWTDITERKRMEVALRESEERYRFMAENTMDVIWLVDLKSSCFTYFSPSVHRLHGYTPEEMIGRPWSTILAPDFLPHFSRDLAARIASFDAGDKLAQLRTQEVEVLNKDGSKIQVEIATTLLPDAAGRASRALGITRDLTERRRAETQLRKLSQIVEQAPLSIVITDLAGTIDYVNPSFCTVTGYSPEEVVGQNPRILKSGETPAEVYREMWQALTRGRTWSGELHNRKKNGEIYIENAVIAPVVDQAGRTTHFVALKEDVTTQKRTVALLAKEREVSEMKTRFISVTSHEFRTPMAAAMGSVELLANHLDRLAPAKRDELLNRITVSLRRMTEMLDEILLLNRMDAKRVEVCPGLLDLRLLVQNSLEETRLADHAAHRFALEISGDTAGFVTDPSLMQHILSNLLSNAVRYSPAGSQVTVRLAVGAAGARLEIEDQGIGIPPADVTRLFHPFERGSNVGTIKGTGLGLSIVKRMIELLGGTVGIESAPGAGSRFVIQHPRLPAPPA